MGNFENLTTTQTEYIDQLLRLADKSLSTPEPVIKDDPMATKLIGSTIGSEIYLVANISRISSLLSSLQVYFIILPALIAMYLGEKIGEKIGKITGKMTSKKKERQKQVNYCQELVKKMQGIYEKLQALIKEHARTNKEKDEIIKEMAEKIAEYEVIIEAMKEQIDYLMSNLSCA